MEPQGTMFNMADRCQIPAYHHWAASAHLPMGNFTQLVLRARRRRLGIREGNSVREAFPNPLGSLGNPNSAPCLLVTNKPLRKKDIKPQDLLLIGPAS